MARGGEQRIPRPPGARTGPHAPWARVPAARRRLDLATVRDRLETLPAATDAEPRSSGSQKAAVLVLLFEEDGIARVILTRRPDSMPTHRGEVAFPGGRYDAEVDADLQATALRESHEEIGVDPKEVEVVARLDGLATYASRFTIAPFVGFLGGRPVLRPDPVEVVRAFDVPLSELMHPEAYRSEVWGRRPGYGSDFVVSFFELEGDTVWGATARVLTNLLTHLVGAESSPTEEL